MKGRFILRSGAFWLIVGTLFLLSPLHPAQARAGGWEQMKEKMAIAKELHDLKLGPEKEAALLALEHKYAKERKSLVSALQKYREDLRATLAAPASDEVKLKELMSAATATQDKLLNSFKMERDEAMALMTPTQQGQFFMLMDNWFQEMIKNS